MTRTYQAMMAPNGTVTRLPEPPAPWTEYQSVHAPIEQREGWWETIYVLEPQPDSPRSYVPILRRYLGRETPAGWRFGYGWSEQAADESVHNGFAYHSPAQWKGQTVWVENSDGPCPTGHKRLSVMHHLQPPSEDDPNQSCSNFYHYCPTGLLECYDCPGSLGIADEPEPYECTLQGKAA